MLVTAVSRAFFTPVKCEDPFSPILIPGGEGRWMGKPQPGADGSEPGPARGAGTTLKADGQDNSCPKRRTRGVS